jgi:2-keto-4-pentenoate hydratase/2-oxohepta-3-ene-1,7-dioic acid hydratase in catechol pathway
MESQHRLWVRFSACEGLTGFGTLQDDQVAEHRGDMFGISGPTGRMFKLDAVRLLCPFQPGKVLALWNNFAALGEKLGLAVPAEPLYLLKAPNAFANPGDAILQPRSKGKVIYEGELAIVIGKTARGVGEADALDHVFGYTCVNDVTEVDILNRDPSFTQWTRAKGMDTFCPMGPAIATGLDASTLVVRTILNGEVRQEYPVSDMRFSVAQIVSLISTDITLYPGDAILCGTSIGVGSMKPGSEVSVEIAGIGRLDNRYVARA